MHHHHHQTVQVINGGPEEGPPPYSKPRPSSAPTAAPLLSAAEPGHPCAPHCEQEEEQNVAEVQENAQDKSTEGVQEEARKEGTGSSGKRKQGRPQGQACKESTRDTGKRKVSEMQVEEAQMEARKADEDDDVVITNLGILAFQKRAHFGKLQNFKFPHLSQSSWPQ